MKIKLGNTNINKVYGTGFQTSKIGVPYGPELITNGVFDTDLTGWEVYSTYVFDTAERNSEGQLHLVWDGTLGIFRTTPANINVVAGKSYKFSFDYDVASGSISDIFLKGTPSSPYYGNISGQGTYEAIYEAPATQTLNLRIDQTSLGDYTLDNFSLKELLLI